MPVLLRWFLRLGPTNPIAVRLVANGSRRSRHLYIRMGYLGALIVVLLYALLMKVQGDTAAYQDLAAAGATSFKWVAYLQIALICMMAPVFMAGAIAQEADPRTWDILLTTPLGATEIVLGNLLGRLFFILALLASSLPLFAVTQYFGGVPGDTIFASYLIAACAALVVGCLAIALSVSRLVGRRAVFAFYVGVVSYIAVTWAIDALTASPGLVSWMTSLNPFLALRALLDSAGYARFPAGSQAGGLGAWFLEKPVTTFCLLSLALSIVLIVASIITVRIGGIAGIGGLSGRTGTSGGPAPWWRKMLGLGAAGSDVRPARTVWSNPVAWREAASRNATLGRIAARYAFIAIGVGWAVVLLWLWHKGTLNTTQARTILEFTILGELGVVTLVAINMAATAVSREREDGTLDLILTTPITPAMYLAGKLQGIVAYALPMLIVPVATLGLAGLYVLIGGFGHDPKGLTATFTTVLAGGATGGIPVPAVLPEAGLLLLLIGVPFIALCVVIGLSLSVRSKGTIGSVMIAVGIVAAVAGTVGLCAWNAASGLAILGPVVAGASPASVAHASIFPEDALAETIGRNDLSTARTALFIGVLLAAGVHVFVVLAMRSAMVRGFDMTVRKLAGMK